MLRGSQNRARFSSTTTTTHLTAIIFSPGDSGTLLTLPSESVAQAYATGEQKADFERHVVSVKHYEDKMSGNINHSNE